MTNKRQLARAALQAWKTKTTAEMFIEQHKDVHFAKTTKSPKVELVSHNEHLVELVSHNEHVIELIAEQFRSMSESIRKARCLITPSFSEVYANSMSLNDVIIIEDDNSFETAIKSFDFLQPPRSVPKEFNLDSYSNVIASTLNPLRC